MRFFSIASIVLMIAFQVGAQDSLTHDPVVPKKTMAIVPFMEQMYFNDLSQLWYQTGESKSQEDQILSISKQMVKVLNDSLVDSYTLLDLNHIQTIGTVDYLSEFYSIGNYGFADTFPQKEPKFKLLRTKKEAEPEESSPSMSSTDIRTQAELRNNQFLNMMIRDFKNYKKRCQELKVDQVLFITQLEVKGDFGSPYNSGQETDYFIVIHYALYDKDGLLLLGNKTNKVTTNEKARYNYFIQNDISKAATSIFTAIDQMNKKEALKKKKKQ